MARRIAERTTSSSISQRTARASTSPDKQGRTPLDWAAGVFLATHPPVRKPETIALLERLQQERKAAEATAAR